MEAMASGLPVITTAVGAVSEEIEHGVCGFLIPPQDVKALAEVTLRLVRDPQLRNAMSAAARQSADQKFNAATNYRQVLAVCKGCVDVQRSSKAR
jgi:glycosyltransferase involved in cell wall biosynthesis